MKISKLGLKLEKNPHVIFRKMKDSQVIINYKTGDIMDLNETGSFIWNYLPNRISTILDALTSEYKNSRKKIKDDLLIFLNELINKNFIITKDRGRILGMDKIAIPEIEVREKIKDLGIQRRIPITAEIELLNQCNLECVHCFNITDGGKKPMGTAGVKHVIDELFKIGTVLIILTGGEVFLRKDIEEIIDYADKKDFLIRILTNGTLIGDKEVKMLKGYKIISVQLSVYSHIPKIHDSITKRNGSFNKSITAIKKMIKNGIRVEIATPLMKVNFPEHKGVKKLAANLGIRHRYSYPIFERNNGLKDVYALRPSQKEILHFFSEDLSQIVYTPRTKDEFICGVGVNTCMVNPQGDLFPCTLLNIKIGNLLEEKFEDLWSSSELLKGLRKLRFSNLKKCVKCAASPYCSICLGHNWKASKRLLQPAKVSCDYALNSMKAIKKMNHQANFQKTERR